MKDCYAKLTNMLAKEIDKTIIGEGTKYIVHKSKPYDGPPIVYMPFENFPICEDYVNPTIMSEGKFYCTIPAGVCLNSSYFIPITLPWV